MTITTHLCGGLGNQLFQYATARNLSARYSARLLIDTSWFRRKWRGTTPRELEIFKYGIAATELPRAAQPMSRLLGSRLAAELINRLSARQIALEASFGHDPQLGHASPPLYLKGYWQSPRYFEAIRPTLIRELGRPKLLPDEDLVLGRRIMNCHSVSIHVRRGDYVSLPSAANAHGTCSLEYYSTAIKRILTEIPDPVFFVFSDDPTWAKANLRISGQVAHIDRGTKRATSDLYLMTCCRHSILANSSFGWWGAYLAPSERRLVLAPRNGFHRTLVNQDLYPSNWITL
jgi:hypothetical protein